MTQTLRTVSPESVGLSSERLAKLDEHLKRVFVDSGMAPCAMTLVARRGEIAHLGLSGLADKERGKAVAEDTLFRIYSMTKPLTSVLFMMLVEEGKVALDDPVSGLIPAWKDLGVYESGELGSFKSRPPTRPMLMIDLMRHTAGLTYNFQGRTPVDAAYTALNVMANFDSRLDKAIADLADLPLEFDPGAYWNYSVATDVLGHLIGIIEGRPFEEVMRDRLLIPLGMTDTGFQVPADKADRLAACYWLQADDTSVLQDDPAASPFLKPPVLVSGGGGLVSTAADYLRFCRMMLNKGELDGVRYLSPKTVALMTANHLPGKQSLNDMSVSLFSEASYAGVGFGLGVAVVDDPAAMLLPGSKGGYFWGGAAATYFWIDPAEDLIVIFMTQLIGALRLPIRRDLRNLVYAAVIEANI